MTIPTDTLVGTLVYEADCQDGRAQVNAAVVAENRGVRVLSVHGRFAAISLSNYYLTRQEAAMACLDYLRGVRAYVDRDIAEMEAML